LLSMNGWESAEVPLNQRLHCRQVEGPYEEKREVTGIGETVFIKRERFLEIPLIHRCSCRETAARMILIHDVRQGFSKCKLRNRGLVRKSGPDLRALDLESVGVRSRLREPEVNELKHRFQVPA